jgi:hypothetical protein
MLPTTPSSEPTIPEPPAPPSRRRRDAAIVAALSALAAAYVLLLFLANWLRSTPEPANPDAEWFDPDRTGVPPYSYHDLPVVSARECGLADKEEVIGVSVNGKHRAYRVIALRSTPMVHVVNDLVDDVPVTLAHCDRTGCTQAFTAPERGKRLFVGLGGWRRGHMWLRAGDGVYNHRTLAPAVPGFPEFPYPNLPFERTTWKAWRTAHPDTDGYIGGGALYPPRPK